MKNGKNVVKLPDSVRISGGAEATGNGNGVFEAGGIRVTAVPEDGAVAAYLQAEGISVSSIELVWKAAAGNSGKVLGDAWERGYGDFEWKEKKDADVLPWYFLDDRGNEIYAFGVRVRPAAMCMWRFEDDDLVLRMDVRSGGEGVVLGARKLKMAEIVMYSFETDAFEAAQSFCGIMCGDPVLPAAPVYGSNNWYYAYGVSSEKEILGDAAYLAKMTEGCANRPFMVIDDGWQVAHTASYNGGPWDTGNDDYKDMGRLASGIRGLGVRPGIWFRPLLDEHEDIPAEWRLERDPAVLDISVPEVITKVQEDVRRIRGWGYELIKHDFSTFDVFGRWGGSMGSELTDTGWSFRDRSRTTAEIITGFYRAIKEAAGDVIILGCNCIGHLGAGLMEANRTGDDTSGVEWERTKKMGINTLAFRMPQHGRFFAADADCVGITDRIPWEKNRQWMELLSLSGTPFFVSVKPGTLDPEQEEELKAAYRRASQTGAAAVPLDWKETLQPAKWDTTDGIKEYDWDRPGA